MNRNYSVHELVVCIISITALGLGFLAPQADWKLCLIGICILVLLMIFHIYTPKIANLSPDNPKVKTMRRMNIVSIVLVVFCFVVMEWAEKLPWFQAHQDLWPYAVMLLIVISTGNVAPKLPFNRYMGLRLPWTIRDEDTWRVAHRLLGYLTFPAALVILIGGIILQSEKAALVGLMSWIVVPGVYSGYYYYLRIQGKR